MAVQHAVTSLDPAHTFPKEQTVLKEQTEENEDNAASKGKKDII
jgi:hypothetical protein